MLRDLQDLSDGERATNGWKIGNVSDITSCTLRNSENIRLFDARGFIFTFLFMGGHLDMILL